MRLHRAALPVLCALFLLLTIPCALASVDDLWVYADESDASAVHWYADSGKRYLFLPACADLSALRIGFTGEDTVSIDGGAALHSGEVTAALTLGESHTLAWSGGEVTLICMQSENLPALFVTTASGSLDSIHRKKTNEETGTLYLVSADGEVGYDGDLRQIRGRGNATFQYAKKGYQIKLEHKTALCGMEKARTWVLLANHYDNTLLRNQLAFVLARQSGLRYTPECQAADLYANGEYLGSYLLCEKVQVGDGRVEITDLEEVNEEANEHAEDEQDAADESGELTSAVQADEAGEPFGKKYYRAGTSKGVALETEPSDVTGGYLLEVEYANRYSAETSGFVTKKGQAVVIKSPEEASEAEVSYISSLVQEFENALFSASGTDKATGRSYSEIVDLDSFARKYVLEEFSKNYDANKSSQYFYKDTDAVDGLIYAGPAWDYDSAFGNFGSGAASPTLKSRGLFVATNRSYAYSWYPELCEKDDFMALVKQIWQEDYLPILRTLLLNSGEREGVLTLAEMAEPLRASADMNFTRWKIMNAKQRVAKTGATYQENLDYLERFLKRRTAYLCELWGGEFDAGDAAQ